MILRIGGLNKYVKCDGGVFSLAAFMIQKELWRRHELDFPRGDITFQNEESAITLVSARVPSTHYTMQRFDRL